MTLFRYLFWKFAYKAISLLVSPLLRWQEKIQVRLEQAEKQLQEHNLPVLTISGRRYVQIEGKIIPIDNE
jgi:cellobiose-specific phosphotransferase system component IIB